MLIKVNVPYEYILNDEEIEIFRNKVLENIQNYFEEIDENNKITINDISFEVIKNYLKETLPEYIKESKSDYNSGYSGIVCDGYFNTISFNYYEDDVRELISEISEQIYNSFKEEQK